MKQYVKVNIPGLFLFICLLTNLFSLDTSTEMSNIPENLKGKKRTDRSIRMNFVVDASVNTVFTLWTTMKGCRKFFGEDALIDLKPGGKYEIYFHPRTHPESDINSSKGAKILWIKKNRELAFEWTMPPFAREYNTRPLPTWVEVNLQPIKNHPNKTHVQVEHHGFKRGGKWDRAYEFFVRGWSDILFRLDRHCSQQNAE